jgi:hypothetical protein
VVMVAMCSIVVPYFGRPTPGDLPAGEPRGTAGDRAPAAMTRAIAFRIGWAAVKRRYAKMDGDGLLRR